MKLLRTRQSRREETDLAVARGLGWASIGIGLTEILAPGQVEKMLGIGNGQHTRVLRAMGVREIAQGIDILAHEDPTPGVWARVAGDMLDNALLAVAAKRSRNRHRLELVRHQPPRRRLALLRLYGLRSHAGPPLRHPPARAHRAGKLPLDPLAQRVACTGDRNAATCADRGVMRAFP